MITQHLIRSGNLRQIYQLIDQNIGISRARLAKITKLSKTTVSSLVDELIAGGYVLDCGSRCQPAAGPAPKCSARERRGQCGGCDKLAACAAGHCAGGGR